MSKNTSITLGEHFDNFINQKVDEGRFTSASEVVRAALRMFEDNEQKTSTLPLLLEEGQQRCNAEYNYESFMNELDEELDK